MGNELTKAWTHHGLKATHTRKERKKVKLATFALTFLILGSLAFLMPTVQTQDPPISPVPVVAPTVPLEGNLTFTFYPDESIKMKVIGCIEQAIDVYSAPPVYHAYLNLASSPSGVNLTDVTGTFVLKLSPIYSMLLAALELDIEMHSEGLRGNTTILFNMPGYLGVNGTTGAFTDESTGENNLDFDLTITIWYAVIPEEEIQGFIETFPMLESQIVTQISELMEGNVTLKDLTYSGETGFASATITIAGSLVGDFLKGGTALSTNLLPLLGLEDPETTPFSPEDLMYTKAKYVDMHIWYDRNEFAFIMESEGVIEGDLDRQFNVMKDIYLEQLLQFEDTPPEWALMINDVLLPTNISRDNLGMTLEYLFDGENIKLDFVVDGLVFKPPTTEAFLTLLDKALAGGSLPSFSLIFEGGSDGEMFVGIEVPPTTSEPVLAFPRKVVWIVDNLTNLNLVTFFKVIEEPLPPPPPPPPPLPPFLSNLNITPEDIEVEEGEMVTVSFDIGNIDSQSINYAVDIHIENVNDPPPTWPPYDVTLRIWVDLEPFESKRVSHTITMDTCGDFNVTVHGMTGSFKVGIWPPLRPAEFEFSNLRIFYPGVIPPEVERGETVTVTVSIDVTNVGEDMGGCTVKLKVNGEVVESVDIAAFGGIPPDYDQVTATQLFELTRGEGTYEVEVEGFTESFTVVIPEPPFWNRTEFVIGVIVIIIGIVVIYVWRRGGF